MRISIDASNVSELAVDLSAAPGRLQRNAPRVVKDGAQRIRAGMRADFSGHRHLEELGAHVNMTRLGDLFYEIGIDKGGQGDLGNIAAYGSSNNAPVADKNAALRAQAPIIEEQLGVAAEDDVFGGAA